MRDNSEPSKKIQVSLRTFLVAVLAAGMTLGILGQLFRRQPEVFAFVLYLLATIVPYVLAIVTVFWIGFHRSPPWSLPVCSGCRRDLRWLDLNEVTTCPQCGADLAASKALAFERGPYRSRRMIAWGAALVLMPAVGILGVVLFSRAAGPGPGNLGLLSNQEVIQNRLLPQVDQPWVWRELEQRLALGKLSQQEVDDAVKILIGHMKTNRPNGWKQALSWQSGFLRGAASAGLISEPVLLDLCDAYYGTMAQIHPLPRVREDSRNLRIEAEYGSHWADSLGVGIKLLWEVVAVRLDGEPLDIRQTNKMSGRWSGQYEGALPVGDHKLEVDIECAYIDEALLLGLNTNEMPAKTWPVARKRWTQTVSAACKVYTKDEPILTRVTDLARSPLQTGGIQINRLVVQDDRNGKKRIGLNLDYNVRLVVPIGFDVALDLGDEQIQLGHIFASIQPGRSITGGKQLQKRVDSLDPSIRQADIVLTPNPKQIEQYPEVKEFWGETIVIPNVPLDRFE